MVLAIEADGASYRESGSVRDRDRLRGEHLQRLGWSFHRLWSTNWFCDPKAEVAKLQAAYAEAVRANPPAPPPPQDETRSWSTTPHWPIDPAAPPDDLAPSPGEAAPPDRPASAARPRPAAPRRPQRSHRHQQVSSGRQRITDPGDQAGADRAARRATTVPARRPASGRRLTADDARR